MSGRPRIREPQVRRPALVSVLCRSAGERIAVYRFCESCCLPLAAITALGAEPRRIVSTAPSITETLFALGAGSRLVGVTNYCHYPPEALKITKIGTYLEPHTETILALKPDLVITEDSPIHSKDLFTTLGLPVLKVRFETVADIYASIRTIARGARRPGARRGAGRLHPAATSRRCASRSRDGKPVSLMFLVGRTPNVLEGMVAIGNAPYLNEVMQIAGGRNVFRDAPMRYFRVSQEQIIARNPEVILDMGDMADTSGVTEAHKRWSSLSGTGCRRCRRSRTKRVYAIASDIYVVPGPRVVDCARDLRTHAASRGCPLTALYELRDAGMRYGDREVLRDITLELHAGPHDRDHRAQRGGEVHAAVDPRRPAPRTHSAAASSTASEVRDWPRRKFAQQVSVVPQSPANRVSRSRPSRWC